MSATVTLDEADIDRVRELVSIGAGHAATALAGLTGRTCEMQVPTVQRLAPAHGGGPSPGGEPDVGVLFELEGGTGGVLAVLFQGSTCDRLIERLLGAASGVRRSDDAAQDALREVGNILASHAANAVGATLGVAMLPSVPHLALEAAGEALASLIAARHPHEPALRIAAEFSDRERELRGTLVLVPDTIPRFAPAVGF
jgi:chemotaxis protein CheC